MLPVPTKPTVPSIFISCLRKPGFYRCRRRYSRLHGPVVGSPRARAGAEPRRIVSGRAARRAADACCGGAGGRGSRVPAVVEARRRHDGRRGARAPGTGRDAALRGNDRGARPVSGGIGIAAPRRRPGVRCLGGGTAHPVRDEPLPWRHHSAARRLSRAGEAATPDAEGALSSKEPRYFLYAVRRKAEPGARPGGGESVAYVVRDGAVPEDVRSSVPGTAWELIAGFVDRAEATEAFLRLQRGFGSPTRARLDDPLPPWVAATCRPPGAR